MTNFYGMPEIKTETPKNEVTPVITPETQETELTPAEMEQFNKMEEVAKGIQNINPEETAEMLKNNPEKVERLKLKLKKAWKILMILGETALAGAMLKFVEYTASGNWADTNQNIAIAIGIGPVAFKIIWDLVGLNEKEKKAEK